MNPQEVLKQYFGFEHFRTGQEALIDGILAGRDVLGIMPTGGGKSLCYQIPAILLPGITLVISPLISLMKDQVEALKAVGISAAYINSSLSSEQLHTVYQRLRSGSYRLVYVAPERLEGEGFQAIAGGLEISLIAVDEAHCISQWGQDFRPSYLKIAAFIKRLPSRPCIAAFTATATQEVRQDIIQALQLEKPLQLVTGFDRPNLFFEVRKPENKLTELLRLVAERKGKSGIIYCATRASVERVCSALNQNGFPATRYHAGLEDDERRRNQDDFQFDRCRLMVATNAFGMGIDKSNVSFVIHYNMPKNLEAYYQEAGRAGRDGAPADCILLYSGSDVLTARSLIESSGENAALEPEQRVMLQQLDLRRLARMTEYCKTTACLRGNLLSYFEQAHEEHCNACGNCCGLYEEQDITIPAQMILSCVRRIKAFLGYSVGAGLLIDVLRGSRSSRVLSLRLDSLSTYALLRQTSKTQLRALLDTLEEQGFLQTNLAHGAIELTERASAVLFAGQTVFLRARIVVPSAAPDMEQAKTRALPQEHDPALYEALREVRTKLAQQEQVPAYIICSNASLTDMAAKRPQSRQQLLEVAGIGVVKAEKYGEAFLAVLRLFENKAELQSGD